METVACLQCGSAEASPLYQLPDFLLGRADVTARLVRCCRCGLIYQNPRPTFAEMAAHYPPEYDLYTPAPDQPHTSGPLKLAYQYGMRKRRQFVTRYRQGGRLLDVGCATGVFLRAMRATNGWQVQGVEINPQAAALARERYQLDVRTGTLEEAAFPADAFEAVTLWDVFEHLHDPERSLREIHRILKPAGLLVLRVPNGDSWDAKLFGRYWAGLEPPRHLYVFTARSLETLLRRNGFVPLQSSSASAAYTTFLLSLTFYLRHRGGPLAQRCLSALYHPFFRLLSSPVFYLASVGLRGPLLVAVAQKASGDA